jgi:hypothetical protein
MAVLLCRACTREHRTRGGGGGGGGGCNPIYLKCVNATTARVTHLNMPSVSDAADALNRVCGPKWGDIDHIIKDYLATCTADVLNEGARRNWLARACFV